MDELRPGLHRWTTPHPSWRPDGPGGWDRDVAEGLRVAESPDLRDRGALHAWLAALAELPVELVLPAHGPPVLDGASHEIAAALDRPPW